MAKQNYPYKEMMMDLINLRNYLPQFLNQGKSYDPILKKLIENKVFIDDPDTSIPTLKVLSNICGYTSSKIKSALNKLYEEILFGKEDDDWGLILEVKEVEFIFYLKYFGKGHGFKMKGLPYIPRVGESINLPYFWALLGNRSFYVESVNHDFEGQKQIVMINLIGDSSYNRYFEYKKDEAYYKNEISIKEYCLEDHYYFQKNNYFMD